MTQQDTKVIKEDIKQLPRIFWSSSISTNLPFSIYYSFVVFQIQLLEIQLLKHSPHLTKLQLVEQESYLTSLTYLV